MFSSKMSIISKRKIFIGYVNNYCSYINQGKQCLWTLAIDHCVNMESNGNLSYLVNCSRKFCTKALPKDYNVFGNISYEQSETVEMDEDEKKEETFAESARIPKFRRLTLYEYYKLIKSYADKKDIHLALSVLDLMKENGQKPDIHIYKLLISLFAAHGDVKQCFNLFKKLIDRGLKPLPNIYTSLINACAVCDDKEFALEHLEYLRTHMHSKKIRLNVIQYCAFIKAYGRKNETMTAFEIADEAQDNLGFVSDSMICNLFHAAIGNESHGLRYALTLWHKMKIYKMKINIYHYNLLLRAIRDTMIGNLRTDHVFLAGSNDTEIQVKDVKTTDLLDSPPVLSTSLVRSRKELNKMSHADTRGMDTVSNIELSSLNLNDILQKNRLLLFGGAIHFLNRMISDGVTPDVKTITLIVNLIPPTIKAENQFLKHINKVSVNIDITFFNMLIKKRCMRKCYDDAKDILNEIQRHHLVPNIITFGVLAIGCTKFSDGVELLQQMNNIGYEPNNKILETLLLHACRYKNFSYASYLMTYILKNKIVPSKAILRRLENFDEIILQHLNNEIEHSSKHGFLNRTTYNKFKIKYELWKEKIESSENHYNI